MKHVLVAKMVALKILMSVLADESTALSHSSLSDSVRQGNI